MQVFPWHRRIEMIGLGIWMAEENSVSEKADG